jgi:hypothetical protein
MWECCSNCFNDTQIKKFILDKCHGSDVSRCSFCGSSGVQLIEAELLSDYFDILIKNLEVDPTGSNAASALQQYFAIFNCNIRDKDSLLSKIFDKSKHLLISNYKFTYSGLSSSDWTSFKSEIIDNNRFFPRTPIYKDIFSKSKGSEVLYQLTETLLTTYGSGDDLYRARVSEKLLTAGEMGKPPAHVTSTGRANPVGISYLYLASNLDTCIAEVRPSKSSKVCIATFKPVAPIKLLDLTNPREKATFLLFNDAELKDALNYIALLETFAYELSLPIIPQRSHLDYIPTQFICEFFKAVCGYSGIIFNSSFGFGHNVVLFDDASVRYESIRHHQVLEIINRHNPI